MYVELRNINKFYQDFQAADNVNFGIEKGKLIGLLGPSGSGKTTILRMIAGLETPDTGDIYIDGERVNDKEPSKRGIGFVFQSYALFRYMTVFDNIAFGLKIQKKSKEEIKERVMELIKLIGLEGMEKRYPNQLSGGQRQRVAFARALAPNPHLLLLDEPFAAIDAKVRKELRSWLKELIHKVGITSIFVTHDQDEAIEVADEVIITNHGRIEQKGAPYEIYRHPDSAFVARFIGESSIVTNFGGLKGFEGTYEKEEAVIRPEFVHVFKKGEKIRYQESAETGIVERSIFMGNCIQLSIRVNDLEITAERSLELPQILEGEEVKVVIYRLYVIDGSKTYLLENPNLNDENTIYI